MNLVATRVADVTTIKRLQRVTLRTTFHYTVTPIQVKTGRAQSKSDTYLHLGEMFIFASELILSGCFGLKALIRIEILCVCNTQQVRQRTTTFPPPSKYRKRCLYPNRPPLPLNAQIRKLGEFDSLRDLKEVQMDGVALARENRS